MKKRSSTVAARTPQSAPAPATITRAGVEINLKLKYFHNISSNTQDSNLESLPLAIDGETLTTQPVRRGARSNADGFVEAQLWLIDAHPKQNIACEITAAAGDNSKRTLTAVSAALPHGFSRPR